MLLPLTLKAFFFLTMNTLLLVQAQASSFVSFTGAWSVAGQPSSAAFESPALGSEFKVVVNGETIVLDYSFNRHWTLKLDGSEIRKDVQVADGPKYQEVAFARVQGDSIVIVTSRNRTGVVSREERALRLVGGNLVVEGQRWVDGKVIHTSRLTYHRTK